MNKWINIDSKPIYFLSDHVDTDMIIPAEYLTSISSTGYGQGLFKRFREKDPKSPFNILAPGERNILVAGVNFGCGSSREHAVWALSDFGIKCVIAKSFSDIFTANSLKNGLLPIVISEAQYMELIKNESDQTNIKVNLENQEVIINDKQKIYFEIDSFRKHCILSGLDDLDYLLEHQSAISKFRAEQEKNRYFKTSWITE